MRVKTIVAAALVALAAAGAAYAGNGHGNGHANGPRLGMRYLFLGQLTAAPADGKLSVTVEGGNRAALRAMLGQPVAQTFSYGEGTEFLKWSAGIPSVVQAGDLAAGDYVWIHVRDSAGASLSDIEAQDAALVGDHGAQLSPPSKPLYLFRGTLTAVGSNSVTVDVSGGNAHALRLLIGQATTQTFTTDGNTIFLLWQGKVPTVISLAQLKVGDRVVVRIRAAKGSSLAQVEATAASHVGDREPASGS